MPTPWLWAARWLFALKGRQKIELNLTDSALSTRTLLQLLNHGSDGLALVLIVVPAGQPRVYPWVKCGWGLQGDPFSTGSCLQRLSCMFAERYQTQAQTHGLHYNQTQAHVWDAEQRSLEPWKAQSTLVTKSALSYVCKP